ncbi:hypothetical protein M885DRAFT_291731 [Pelagophyceae sp. CCMP2097]|nr:hypothetical protein M885DRAFT_291731 [Pelagophyceae sp. CCMP2097]
MGEYVGERDAVGARAGRGSYKWPRGAFAYTGEWSNGLMHGHGVLHAGDSTIEGEFHEGEIDGLGVKTWYAVDGGAPTKVYRGELRGGELHGSGELCTSTERYVGAFVGNRREGAHGALTVAAVALELGAWCEATPGDLSEGAWVADVMHGPGALRRGDGFSFRGDFVRGRRTGHGSAEWSGGATYVGVWANDERSRGSYACKQSGVAYDGAWCGRRPFDAFRTTAAPQARRFARQPERIAGRAL